MSSTEHSQHWVDVVVSAGESPDEAIASCRSSIEASARSKGMRCLWNDRVLHEGAVSVPLEPVKETAFT